MYCAQVNIAVFIHFFEKLQCNSNGVITKLINSVMTIISNILNLSLNKLIINKNLKIINNIVNSVIDAVHNAQCFI